MGIRTEYSFSDCGFKYDDSSDIFWIDSEGKVHVGMLAVSSSQKASNSLASGGIYKYYCYNCKKFIYNFHISEKSPTISKEVIIQIIENMDDNTKIIDFDNKFQNCIVCGKDLDLKLEKAFALDIEGNFHVGDVDLNDFDDKPNDFSGKYYGYYCKDCSKQINKFVIHENNANLEDSLMKEILKDHTNDLTVFIDDSYDYCPDCGDELHVLGESSLCPHCRMGILGLDNQTFVD